LFRIALVVFYIMISTENNYYFEAACSVGNQTTHTLQFNKAPTIHDWRTFFVKLKHETETDVECL